ncbi:MAG: flagellar biosynthesis anti-sigma factor FlgM [Sphingomonas bacterium]|nr:flagellar biosynthesis anti-sigma factor FlgM [Sphingomonas bacterium]
MINGIGLSTGSTIGTTHQTGTQGAATVGRIGNTAAREDSAQVSNTITQMAAQGAPIDSGRIEALRAAIKSGSYRIDPQAIAGRMIDTDLKAGL